MTDEQTKLFTEKPPTSTQAGNGAPLAYTMRPTNMSEYVGFDSMLKKWPMLKSLSGGGFVFFGPPGSGKTTIIELLAHLHSLELAKFNAVLGGVADLRKLIKEYKEKCSGRRFALFIDEIHRFNKAQQDALLPYVESGEVFLYGATTESPYHYLTQALKSRTRIIELKALDNEAAEKILNKALVQTQLNLPNELKVKLIQFAQGDARKLLTSVEQLALEKIEWKDEKFNEELLQKILRPAHQYDSSTDRYYDLLSALIKCMRDSDPDSSLLYFSLLMKQGSDPLALARRLIVFASEDIGNADPTALSLAVSTYQAVSFVGLPEASINLSHAIIYLASTFKSNRSFQALKNAQLYITQNPEVNIPTHLLNHGYSANNNEKKNSDLKPFSLYSPSDQGKEKALKEHLERIRSKK